MVITGLDVLLTDHRDLLARKRVGLITNPSGVTRDLTPNVDALRAVGVNLVAMLARVCRFIRSMVTSANRRERCSRTLTLCFSIFKMSARAFTRTPRRLH